MNQLSTRTISLLLLALAIAASPASSQPQPPDGPGDVDLVTRASPPRIRVTCNNNARINKALNRRTANLIQFRGTCIEDVLINRDGVTLEALDASAAIQGSVTVTGASDVTLRGFEVRNGALNCLAVVRNSAALLENISVHDCGGNGILAVGSSQIFLVGSIRSTDNGQSGLTITNASNLTVGGGTTVNLDENGLGLVLQLSSSATLLPGLLTADSNLGPGIVVASGGNLLQEVSRSVQALGNGGPGAILADGASWVAIAGPGTRNLSGNAGPGFLLERGSALDFRGSQTTASDNAGPGIDADDSAIALGDLTAESNGSADVNLAFGARATFDGTSNSVGTIDCDSTVLVRGTLACSP